MTLTFIKTSSFTQILSDYFPSDDAYAEFQQSLLANPEQGTVMPGCGGLRKVRWPDPRRGKGKRGGLRIIYLQVPEASTVLFLDLYDKDEAADLTVAERKAFAEAARRFRAEIAGREARNNEGDKE